MTGKVIVYGGSGGIGFATAKRLKGQGYTLHLAGRNEEKLAACADEIGASFTVGDVANEEFFQRTSQEAADSIDGIVYAVGTINLRSLARFTQEDFINDYKINAVGAALAIQAALPALKKPDGPSSVVLFSSVAARQGFSMHASVGMAKGAVEGLTLSLAAELAPKVRVNAIAPSLTRTPLANSMTSNEQMVSAIAAMHAMQRLGEAADIAAMAAFLVSPDSGWITGQIIGIDGGRSTLRVKS